MAGRRADPASRAFTIAAARSDTWSLVTMLDTWLRIVLSDSTSSCAITALPLPAAMRSRTCRSRSVRAGKAARVEPSPEEKCSITRRAIDEPSSTSPAATARIARRISSCSAPLRR